MKITYKCSFVFYSNFEDILKNNVLHNKYIYKI